jgi:dsDNA-specific endonuclease/ATPase MutS2
LLKNALSVELRIDTVKFYKLHCFVPNVYFEEDALLFPLVQADVPRRELLVPVTELQEAMMQKVRAEKPSSKPAPRKPQEEIIEIDLHIGRLLDNTNGLSPADILNYQLDKFRETLARYSGRKGQKIIFIHGKGEGVLRSSIEKELKSRYKHYSYQDASFREYGFGATMVTIR